MAKRRRPRDEPRGVNGGQKIKSFINWVVGQKAAHGC